MRYFVIFLILIGFVGTAFAVPAPLPEDDFRYSDHVVTGKIISSEIIIDPREDNSAATFYDTIIYIVKVEKWHKNPLADDIITVYGTHFPNDVVPEPNWGVLEFEIGDIVYLYIDKTDEGLKFREYGSKLLYSKDSGKTEITLSPLKQFKSGITIDQIQCKEGFVVVIKKSNGIPNCVKHETLEKLRERGWAEPLGNIISQRPSQSKPEPTLTPHSEPEPDYNFDKTFTLIGKKSKYNLDYLMPSGTITDIKLDCNSLQLVLSVSSTESGILTLLLPEEIIGNIETILVDKIQWNYISYAGNTVTVMIPENTKTVEIKGSYRDSLSGGECR